MSVETLIVPLCLVLSGRVMVTRVCAGGVVGDVGGGGASLASEFWFSCGSVSVEVSPGLICSEFSSASFLSSVASAEDFEE